MEYAGKNVIVACQFATKNSRATFARNAHMSSVSIKRVMSQSSVTFSNAGHVVARHTL